MPRCAVIGSPVGHSLSPTLHRAAYATLGLDDWSYEAIQVHAGGFAAFLASLDRTQWRGLSVTMPHKDDAARAGEPDEVVRLTGVANTVVLGESAPEDRVYNTDVSGFVRALHAHGVASLERVVIVGNGATARSALAAAHQVGATGVTITLRRPERAGDVLALASTLGMSAAVVPLGQPLERADAILSSVPAPGADPHADLLADAAPVVFDVSYDPWPTSLAARAAERGRLILNGLDLLAAQAVDQVRLMTAGTSGGEVRFETLRAAGASELRRRGEADPATMKD